MGIMKLLGTSFSTILNGGNPTADRTITFPDASGTAILDTTSGTVLQVANYTTGVMTTTTTVTPYDNTVPQSSEGTDILTLAFTAKKANSKLKVDVIFNGSTTSNGGVMTLTLFKDADVSALGVSRFSGQANQPYCFTFSYFINAVDISAHTYKIKLGANAGTTTFNGTNGVAEYGGTMASSITITEIAG